MTAQPIHIHQEDPRDPEVILNALPERERPEFLRQYRAAAQAATREVGSYRRLQELLHGWSLRVIAVNQPGFYEALQDVKDGVADTVPIEDVIPDWNERIAAARARRHA